LYCIEISIVTARSRLSSSTIAESLNKIGNSCVSSHAILFPAHWHIYTKYSNNFRKRDRIYCSAIAGDRALGLKILSVALPDCSVVTDPQLGVVYVSSHH
jgi:hypothetical protein